MKKKQIGAVLLALLVLGTFYVTRGTKDAEGLEGKSEAVPQQPDYADSTQWYWTNRQAEADIFYIASTETGDYALGNGQMCHYADTYTDSLRRNIEGEMKGVDALLSGRMNYYTPYYRQCSMESFVSDSLTEVRLVLPTEDVRQAFAYYLTHLNADRPFVLVGFSQGAMIALELVREMDDATYNRMVAAYLIGIAITQEQADDSANIKAAQRADDTGVTICYNSVCDTACTIWPRSALCINPVNWRTDGEPAFFDTEPSPRIPLDQQQKDHLRVTLDTLSNLLLVSGFTATDYILPLIGKEGNYHSREIWLYRQQLQENIAQRVESFFQLKINN